MENNKRGWAALTTGKFPMIKDPKPINRRLNDIMENTKENDYCSILTDEEEEQIVEHLKNRSHCLQGFTRAELTVLIMNVFKTRKAAIGKFHRSCMPFSLYFSTTKYRPHLTFSSQEISIFQKPPFWGRLTCIDKFCSIQSF